jgi:hypothetical protein
MKVRRVSRDPLPAAASLVASKDPDGKTVLILSSSAGVKVSRDLGERWIVPDQPAAGAPIALFGSPFASPVLVTSAGVFRSNDGARAFLPVAGSPAVPLAAELLADAAGSPLLEVRTSGGVLRWNGSEWTSVKKAMLKAASSHRGARKRPCPQHARTWTEPSSGRKVGSVFAHLSRPGLALASAAHAKGGLVYPGRRGMDCFCFSPEVRSPSRPPEADPRVGNAVRRTAVTRSRILEGYIRSDIRQR